MSITITKQIPGRIVPITVNYIHPPIPFRGNDYCAHYTDDQSDQPNCGWGVTLDEAVEDLVDSYDYEDLLPTFEELYGIDLFYANLHWQQIERSYHAPEFRSYPTLLPF